MTKNKNDNDTKDMIIEKQTKAIQELTKKLDKKDKEIEKLKESLKND